MYTAGQATFGWQQVRNIGDIARFGSLVFQIFSVVQLTLILCFALVLAGGGIAQEKDRGTLLLLLMTDLRDRELVWGKLFSGLLIVVVLLAASLPVFFLVHLLGGVALDQIAWSLAICAAAGLAAGSWGALVAFWREKTFQTLAISVLGLVLFVGVAELIIGLFGSGSTVGQWAALLNPYRALLDIWNPLARHTELGVVQVSAFGPVLAMSVLAVLLNVAAIARVRVWNPSRGVHNAAVAEEKRDRDATSAATREIWTNPVIWREIRTRAYGRKIFVIKFAYFVLTAFAVASLYSAGAPGEATAGLMAPIGTAFIGLGLVSLILINAQAVTALTSERDAKTLELLLMTDVSAKEFIFGKLGGILYNAKEAVLIPLALIAFYAFQGGLRLEYLIYLSFGFLVLVCFVSMLGLHAGLSFESSRSAIANSLGTIFFLFIGICIFMMLLVEAHSSFFLQLQSFVVFIGVGSVGLYASLSHKNPSAALRVSAGVLPFLTFYAITEYLLAGSLGVCLAISTAYGFTTLAMLIPAVSEFDVALGRTTLDKG